MRQPTRLIHRMGTSDCIASRWWYPGSPRVARALRNFGLRPDGTGGGPHSGPGDPHEVPATGLQPVHVGWHDDANQLPQGRATLLREEPGGLYGEFRISKTQRGDELLELVADGAVDQFSVGFQPLQDRKRPDGVVERVRAHLAEVSLVTFGAYGMAASVTGIREQSQTPNLDAARELLEGLK